MQSSSSSEPFPISPVRKRIFLQALGATPTAADNKTLSAIIESWGLSRSDVAIKILLDNSFLLEELMLLQDRDVDDLFPTSLQLRDRVQFRTCLKKWIKEVETAHRILSFADEPDPETVQLTVRSSSQDPRIQGREKIQAYLKVMSFPEHQ